MSSAGRRFAIIGRPDDVPVGAGSMSGMTAGARVGDVRAVTMSIHPAVRMEPATEGGS